MRRLSLIIMILSFPIALFGADIHDAITAPLDFSSAINQILSRNTDISLSKLRLDLVRARNIPTRLAFLPSLSLSGVLPLSNNFLTSSQKISIDSNFNLFRWGADYFGWLASLSSEESKKFTIDATLITVEQEAVNALITEIQRVKEVNIYSEIVKNQTELLKIAQERYRKGFLPLQEVEKLIVDLANAKSSLADSQIREAQARAILENLLGSSHIVMEWPWINDFKKGRIEVIVKQELKLSQRPDWSAAQKNIESQTNLLKQNRRLLLPTLDAQFSYGNYSGFFGSFTGWVGMVSVTIPIFDQLTNYSKAKSQAYLKTIAETEMVKLQRDARSQWQTSQLNFQTTIQTAITREETLKLSTKLYEDNLRRFQAGKITANDLTIDRNRMNTANLFAVEGWAAVHITFADLCHSLGYRVSHCIPNEAKQNSKNGS